MNKDKIKLNILNVWVFIILICLLVLIGFIVYLLIESKQGFAAFNINTLFNTSLLNKIMIIIPFYVYIFFDLLSTIMIWAIKWKTKWTKKYKALFGFLVLLLPFIFIFIFVNISRLKIKDEIIKLNKNRNMPNPVYSYPIYPQHIQPNNNGMMYNNNWNNNYYQYPQYGYNQNPNPNNHFESNNNSNYYKK